MAKNKYLITKITINPQRSIDMGPKGWVKLDAGVELQLDPPIDINEADYKEKIKEAYGEARKIVNEEMRRQFKPYATKKDNKEVKGN